MSDLPDEAYTAFCNLCQPPKEMPAQEILDHLRVMHPGTLDDMGVAKWPDGGLVIKGQPDGTVEDLGWEAP